MLKKALLVGINKYPRAGMELRGCVNDVKAMKEVLTSLYDFPEENIRLVLDQEATTKGIIDGLEWLAAGGSAPAVRVFHYAGHGHHVPDKSGDEPDGSDETLVPYDYATKGFLIDDKLKEQYDRFPTNGNLTLIMDCCYSGTNQRDPDNEDIRYRFVPLTYAERKAIAAAKRKFHEDQRRFVLEHIEDIRGVARGSDEELQQKILGIMKLFEKQRFGDHRLREGNVLLAACEDVQKAADAKFGNTFHGAFTYYLVKTLREAQGRINYRDLAEKVGEQLNRHNFVQIPQLECDEGRQSATTFSVFE